MIRSLHFFHSHHTCKVVHCKLKLSRQKLESKLTACYLGLQRGLFYGFWAMVGSQLVKIGLQRGMQFVEKQVYNGVRDLWKIGLQRGMQFVKNRSTTRYAICGFTSPSKSWMRNHPHPLPPPGVYLPLHVLALCEWDIIVQQDPYA